MWQSRFSGTKYGRRIDTNYCKECTKKPSFVKYGANLIFTQPPKLSCLPSKSCRGQTTKNKRKSSIG